MARCTAKGWWLALLAVSVLPTYVVSTDGGSGGTSTVPESDNASCIVPAYSQPLFEVNATEENTRLLLTEGMCYLACMTRFEAFTSLVDIYPIWPFRVVDEEHTCSSGVTKIHECTRGCRIWYMRHQSGQPYTSEIFCAFDCQGECRSECGGENSCINPDTIDLWIARTGCSNDCREFPPCVDGCTGGRFITDEFNKSLVPIPPLRPPSLNNLENSSNLNNRALFRINLTEAIDGRTLMNVENFTWYGFLFRIHDLVTDNITFIWQHNPQEPLDLSSHICRPVRVSFAAVNRHGPSIFSDEVYFFIGEDFTRIPNAPINLQVSDSRDERLEFFPYVTLNVTWESPEVERYLLYYEVYLEKITTSGEVEGCEVNGTVITSLILPVEPDKVHSVVIEATEELQDPVMGHTYRVKVISVGEDRNQSACALHTTRSLNDYQLQIVNYDCTSAVLVRNGSSSRFPYFSFDLNWTLAPNVAFGNYIHGFNISGFSLFALRVSFQPHNLHMFESPLTIDSVINETNYNYVENRYSDSVRLPVMENFPKFRFTLSVIWNTLELDSMTTGPLMCELNSTSPRPSDVNNFSVISTAQLSPGVIIVEASWIAPLDANGILSNYTLCLTKDPLVGSSAVASNGCESIESDATSVNTTLTYEPTSFHGTMYIQIQPSNSITSGRWSDPYSIDIMEILNTGPTFRLHSGEIAAIVLCLLVPIVVALCIFFLIYFLRNQHRKKHLMGSEAKITLKQPNTAEIRHRITLCRETSLCLYSHDLVSSY